MAESELNILLKLTDNATLVLSQNIEKLEKSFDQFGRKTKQIGRDISNLGQTMTFVGGGITAVFIKALNDSKDVSLEVGRAINNLSLEARELQKTIAEAVVPVVDKLTNIFHQLNQAIKSIPEPLREQILQFTLLAGIFLTFSGIITVLIGKIISTVGVIFKLISALLLMNPTLLIISGAVAGLIFLMFKYDEATKNVLNTFQALFLSLKQGFFEIKAQMEFFIASSLEGLSLLFDYLSKLPGPMKEFFQAMALNSLETANNIRRLGNEDLINAKIAAIELENIFKNEDGSWVKGFEGVKDNIIKIIEWIKKLGEETPKATKSMRESFDAVISRVGDLQSALNAAASMGKGWAKAAAALALAMAIVNTAVGVTDRLANRENFPWPVPLILAGIIAAAGAIQIATIASQKFHEGGIVKAHNGLAVDEVPIIAQTGEGILSRRGMAAIGGAPTLNALNQGQNTGGISVTINYPRFTSRQDMREVVDSIGDEIYRQLSYARGF